MVEIDGEKLMVSSSNFDDGSMIVSVGTTDFDNHGDSDFMEMMINKDGKIDYFTLPTGKDDYQRMYKIKPSHYGRMKTQNETNESAGGDFIRIDGDGKYAESFGAEDDNSTTCEDCGVKIGYDEAFDWEGLDRCEDCYDYWMMKDRQNYGGDETDCISCGFSISPNDSRFELVDGLCPDCKDTESFGAEYGKIVGSHGERCWECGGVIPTLEGGPYDASILCDCESFGAELADYPHPMSDRQKYRIRKLGGRIDKSMSRSQASQYIKSLMRIDPLHAETNALDCSACQGWGWNEDLNMVCEADGCIGGWIVPKKPSLLERGLELGAGVGMGMAGVAILFGVLGGAVGFAAEELKKRRD